MIERLIKFINQLLGNYGVVSSIRFMSVMTVTTIMSVWAFLSIKNNQVLDVPFGVYTVFIAALLGKVSQKFLEEKQGS